MGDSIDLEDGQIWGGANWLVRNVIGAIAEIINEDGNDPKFGAWLDDCSDRAPGLAGFDLRGLTAERREAFFSAAKRALERKREKGAEGWNMPEVFDGYIESFELLVNRSGSPCFDGTTEWDGTFIDHDDLWNATPAEQDTEVKGQPKSE